MKVISRDEAYNIIKSGRDIIEYLDDLSICKIMAIDHSPIIYGFIFSKGDKYSYLLLYKSISRCQIYQTGEEYTSFEQCLKWCKYMLSNFPLYGFSSTYKIL